MPVHFYFKEKVRLENRRALKSFIDSLFQKESRSLESLTYIFCSDDFLLNMNKEYLAHDYYTDIISFDLSESRTGPVTGEIYISIDRVKDNAERLKVSFQQELHRVIFHGALHLCGYKDKTKPQQKEMRTMEDQYLKAYGL